MRVSCNCLTALLILPALAASAVVTTPGALNTALGTTQQAAVISLSGVNPLSCPQISMSQTWTGGKLIFSDSPESPATRGMLYMDTNLAATAASVPNRIFAYHVNSNSVSRMRFSVLIQNNGAATATLTVTQAGLAGPSTDYPFTGQAAFSRWLTSSPVAGVSVAPGQVVRLDSNFDTVNVPQNFLMNGIWDYTFTQPHSVMICALNTSDDPVAVGPTLAVLPRDSHERGTFSFCNKIYATGAGVTVNTTGGIQQYPIGGSGDTFATGFDNAVSPPTAENDSGNYGVLYFLNHALRASDNRALGFAITPRGGAWSGAVEADAGYLPGGSFVLPSGVETFSDETEAAIAAAYLPGTTGLTAHLQFMPTGGISLPLRMLVIPFNSISPTLAAISNFTVNAGQTVSFSAVAADAALGRPLIFSLPSAPAGAAIGTISGAFQWRPPVSKAGSSNTVQVRVSDDSTPPLTATQAFTIVVNPLAPVTLTLAGTSAAQTRVGVAGPIGPDYVLQGNTTPATSGWTNLVTNTPASSPFTMTDTNASVLPARFYRVHLQP